jgi:hypothetical protein
MQSVYRGSESVIALGDLAAFVVRAQVDLNNVPRVRPIGVMILRLGDRRDPSHKTKRLGKIYEYKLFIERTIDFLPLLCHATTLGCCVRTRLVERGVASDSAVLASAKRRPLT